MGVTMEKIKINTKGNSKTLDEAFEEFQQFNKVKDLSEWTIIDYDTSYQTFTKFYGGENLCNSVGLQTINAFITYLKENRKINNISINTHLVHLRTFINYCIRSGYAESFKVPRIKAEKKIKETYTESELIILLKKPDIKKCRFSEYRDWVFINYLLATGNRVSTILNIKIEDIDFNNDTIILKKTKNRNQQIIPISNSLKTVLQEYLKYRKGTAEDYLFCNSSRGEIGKGVHNIVNKQIQPFKGGKQNIDTFVPTYICQKLDIERAVIFSD
jgi:integrase/recombinase XerD